MRKIKLTSLYKRFRQNSLPSALKGLKEQNLTQI